jgi:hypothetical protein
MKVGARISVGIAVGFAALAASLLACEIALRLLAPRSSALYIPDARIGVIHEPNAVGRWISSEYAVPLRINRDGFRDRDFDLSRPSGVLRVAVIGDSYVEAFQVPLERTAHKVLEARLRKAGHRAEVAGLGVGGFGTAQELLLFGAYARALDPQVVVLFFNPGNDVHDNSQGLKRDSRLPHFHLEGERLIESPFAPAPRWRARLSNRLRNLSQLYALARDAAARAGSGGTGGGLPDELFVYCQDPEGAWAEAWRLTEALLAEFAASVAASGARLVVAIVANQIQLPGRWEEAVARWPELAGPRCSPMVPVRRAREFLRSKGIPVIDLVDAFNRRVRATGERPHFEADGHWNETGHRWAAEEIERFLLGHEGWLAPSPIVMESTAPAVAQPRASQGNAPRSE